MRTVDYVVTYCKHGYWLWFVYCLPKIILICQTKKIHNCMPIVWLWCNCISAWELTPVMAPKNRHDKLAYTEAGK